MCFNINNTLLIDINHNTPATAQASSNIIRCALAAIAVAVLEDVIKEVGIGWTFTLLGAGVVGSGVLYWVERQWGMGWRTVVKGSVRGHELTKSIVKAEDGGVVERKGGDVEGIVKEGKIESGDAVANKHQDAEGAVSRPIREV